jgi:hypothetical protein
MDLPNFLRREYICRRLEKVNKSRKNALRIAEIWPQYRPQFTRVLPQNFLALVKSKTQSSLVFIQPYALYCYNK